MTDGSAFAIDPVRAKGELIEVPTADHAGSGIFIIDTVGESVVAGDVLYMKSDGKWWKADADAAATMPGAGLAMEAKNDGEDCKILLFGFFRDDTWNWEVGGLLYVSTTPGPPTQTAPTGDHVQVIGVAITADVILFDALYALLSAADIPALDAAKITSGRFGMPRMPDGTAGKILIAQGAGEDPAYGDPIPKTVDESGSFSYTTGYGTDETDISALFTTALTGTTRRKYFVWIDIYAMQQDAAAWTELRVKVKVKVDGTNYRLVDGVDATKTGYPLVLVEIPPVARDVQITFKLDVGLAANRTVYYHYVKEVLE